MPITTQKITPKMHAEVQATLEETRRVRESRRSKRAPKRDTTDSELVAGVIDVAAVYARFNRRSEPDS